ncbi:hypothetical protein ACRALDRAFT_2040849 [Sodiomyces alcalophilus JCM 7366]|uniref:uncharacterized protein n=1 Tax=Sodiomyces alcalophilus JCM 7366 TaxID=591952 RepID=UPI0039B53940
MYNGQVCRYLDCDATCGPRDLENVAGAIPLGHGPRVPTVRPGAACQGKARGLRSQPGLENWQLLTEAADAGLRIQWWISRGPGRDSSPDDDSGVQRTLHVYIPSLQADGGRQGQ